MKNYFTEKTAMDIPWIESPFFESILNNSDYTEEERETLIKYNKDGYIVIDLELDDSFIGNLIQGVQDELDKLPTQDSRYHYSDSPRVFEAWRTNQFVLDLARHPKILKTLEFLYNKKPVPFQTINFLKGSNQPLHQDSIHFYTQPERWMVGTWTALEDMSELNGPLNIVPGSHKYTHYNFQNLNLPVVEFGNQFENYSEYENFLIHLVETMGQSKKKWIGKKGQTLIWASNLLHGGAEIMDKNLTRHSQATHFYFEGCNHYYAPLFSDVVNGMYSDKDLTNKDILNHIIR
jgi:hypothetical protein